MLVFCLPKKVIVVTTWAGEISGINLYYNIVVTSNNCKGDFDFPPPEFGKSEPYCRHHARLVDKGYYIEETHAYKVSCGDIYCWRHGTKARRKHWLKKSKLFGSYKYAYPLIINIDPVPTATDLNYIAKKAREIILQWIGAGKVYVILHPMDQEWHLNILVECSHRRFFSREKNFGEHIGRGFGRKKYKCWKDCKDSLLAHLAINKTYKIHVRKGKKKHRNNPKRWLNYVLRTWTGRKAGEETPVGGGYRSFWGFVGRNRLVQVDEIIPEWEPALTKNDRADTLRPVILVHRPSNDALIYEYWGGKLKSEGPKCRSP